MSIGEKIKEKYDQCSSFLTLSRQLTDAYPEESGGVEVKAINSTVSETALTTSVPSSPSIPPVSIPAYKSFKKRPLSFTEDTDDDDFNIDMDLSDNNSSGLSMEGDHTPAKHLHTTSVTTHSWRSTPTSMGLTPEPGSFNDIFTAEDGTESNSGPTNTDVSIAMNMNINTHNTASCYHPSRTPANSIMATTASNVPPLTIVRKLEHQSYFSLIFSPMDTPFPLSLTMFPLHVQPNRLYSPLLLVFVAASSLM